MDFTDPYFEATQALMTKTGSGVTSLDDLAGKTITVQDGTTGADYVRERPRTPRSSRSRTPR